MRTTYRSHGGNFAYWQQRWEQIPADDGAISLEHYPGRYAEAVMGMVDGPVLEAGCGAGRVLLHYHRQGRDIVGIDFIETAVGKLKEIQPDLRLSATDITDLPFKDGGFDAVLAFGLYHNLETGLEKALLETHRVLHSGGILCVSVRVDNIQNRIIDWLAERGVKKNATQNFHKINYTVREFNSELAKAGFTVIGSEFVENMPFLYKFSTFRHSTHRRFDEHMARTEGYRLSFLGSLLQKTLVGVSPESFCNIMVTRARVA